MVRHCWLLSIMTPWILTTNTRCGRVKNGWPHDSGENLMSERTDNATESGAHAVGPGMVVAMHYDLYTAEAEKIETSKGGNPILFLFGDSSVLAALQEALDGKLAGDDFSVTIPHEKAYGRRYPDRMRRMPRKQIDGGKKQTFRPGQVIHLRNEQGPTHATIVKAGKFMIELDMNHPLAGVDLTFDVAIDTVRPASDEELAHGHAHGVGGHQH